MIQQSELLGVSQPDVVPAALLCGAVEDFRRTGFYSRWPYYTGAILAIIGSLPGYYLIEKPALAYLERISMSPWTMPRIITLASSNFLLLKLQFIMQSPSSTYLELAGVGKCDDCNAMTIFTETNQGQGRRRARKRGKRLGLSSKNGQ